MVARALLELLAAGVRSPSELAVAELAVAGLGGAGGCDRPPDCPSVETLFGTSARISTSTVTAASSPSSGLADGEEVECRCEEGALMAVPDRNRAMRLTQLLSSYPNVITDSQPMNLIVPYISAFGDSVEGS